jgi:hypothetical protein
MPDTHTGRRLALRCMSIRLEEEQVNSNAHLMRHTASKQAEQKFCRAFAQKKSGSVRMQHIERYVQPADWDYEHAMDNL